MTEFFRFPHTPHLAWLGDGEPRDDKVLPPDEVRRILMEGVIVEEKLDGANLGFSVSADGRLQAQNRSHYLVTPYVGQFGRLRSWLLPREETLIEALGSHLIAFGEWCAARHSLMYQQLPDWWLLFDVYDRSEQRFWSTARRDIWATRLCVAKVPTLTRGQLSLQDLIQMLEVRGSEFSTGPLEGMVVRAERGDWLRARAKLVQADFTQNMDDHWRARTLEWNRLRNTQ
jgi:ATP-dependent RNA circularization protein (DNA/RNA ligase family)